VTLNDRLNTESMLIIKIIFDFLSTLTIWTQPQGRGLIIFCRLIYEIIYAKNENIS
jgi:hypothetical protein